jgi:hypothetical protein
MTQAQALTAARTYYIELAQACINDANKGILLVNDLPKFITWQKQAIEAFKAGKNDHTFTMQQRAHYIQTGECVALLS